MADKLPTTLDLETSLEWIRNQKFKSKSTLPSDAVIKLLRRMAGAPQTRLRGAALRAFRHIAAINAPNGVDLLNRHRVHLMTVKSLEREAKYLEERMQALKLLRAIAQYSPEKVPRTLIRSLIAIAGHRDDQLKEAALESIREFALLNTRMVAECGGITVMVSAILDPTLTHMADSVLFTLLHLMNQKETRVWFRSSLDLATLLAPFTSSDGVVEGEEERKVRRKLSRKAIVMMMRTWTGLSILASDPQGLRSLVQMLVQPVSYDLRKDVLDTILEIFNTVNPLRASSLGSAHAVPNTGDGKRNNTQDEFGEDGDDDGDGNLYGIGSYGAEPYMAEYWGVGPGAAGSKELAAGGFHAERVPGRHAHVHTLLDNYLVMVLLAFVQYGLVEALVELSVSSAPPMSRTATQLLSFVSRFSTRLLPNNVSRRLLSQKKLVASAVDAARAGEVVDRARAQRAAHVIGILSRIVGSGYDTALATLLSRSTYEDGLALASELALAGSHERAHLNLGVFPRSVIVSRMTVRELLSAKTFVQSGDMQAPPMPQRTNSGSTGGKSLKAAFKRMSKSLTANASKGETSFPVVEANNQLVAEDQTNLAAPLVANRGHRKFVQQLIMTDMSQSKKSTSLVLSGGLPEEVKRLMEKARIMIKVERREWSRWDWIAIDELIQGPCQNHDTCVEVLKTKFFKRLSAFFAVAANAPFAQLPWEPDCVAYTNVATSMLRLLLNIPEAHEFLTEDRRGRIAAQISEALQLELNHAEDADGFERAQTGAYEGGLGRPTLGGLHDRDALSNKTRGKAAPHAHDEDDDEDDFDLTGFQGNRVFTSQACSTTMTREFFVFLGVFASSTNGVVILEQLGIFNTLNRLALHREKDYILRLAISHLDYSGPSAKQPREWLQLILLNNKVSLDLKKFAIGFFRSMLRSAQNQERGVAQWILNLIFTQLRFAEVASDALSVLIEAAHYPLYLDIMVAMLEETVNGVKNEFNIHMGVLQTAPARRLLLKLLGNEIGVKALSKLGWLKTIMSEWDNEEYNRYLQRIDAALLYQLVDQRKASAAWSKTVTLPRPIPVRAHEASALSEPGFAANELQWLFRMPWRIEVWAESSIGTIRVPMDAFIDCSRLRPESIFSPGEKHEEGDEDVPRGICITAVPPWSRDKDNEKRQRARPFIVPEDATVYACLTLANQAIDRRGRTHPGPTAGGGFPYAYGGQRNEHADSGSVAFGNTIGGIGRDSKFRAFSRRHATTRGGVFSTATGRPSVQSDDIGVDDIGDAFAEAPGVSSDAEFVRPLSDDRFWIKCTPPARKQGLKQATANANGKGVTGFSLCPSNGAATFHFGPLDNRSDSMAREAGSRDLERDSPAEISKPTEPEVRVVNPLLALKKDKGKDVSAVLGGGVDRSDLPPLLVLKEVRFHLELVPQRFASPSVPVHLLGELAKSDSGLNEIRGAQLMERFLNKMSNEHVTPSERRAALWAIGHVGGTELGFHQLNAIDVFVVQKVHRVATESPCITLRGAACYTLGFFSRHQMGCKALAEFGWATLDSRSHPFATIAVPANPRKSPFSIAIAREHSLDISNAVFAPVDGVLHPDDLSRPLTVASEDCRRVLACISDLSNHIAQKEAHSELMKTLESNPSLFGNVKLYLAVQDLLARYTFELPVRQFVLNVFHAKINFESEQTWQQIDSESFH